MNATKAPNKAKTSGLSAAKKAAGSAKNLAEKLGITPAAVSRWGDEVPLGRVVEVEVATGIHRSVLRPDVFGVAPKRKRAA